MSFEQRVQLLPTLGLGVSTEYGASCAEGALDIMRLRGEHPRMAAFLEVGLEAGRGIDAATEAWLAAGFPTTYHFLDVNLDEPEDFDEGWVSALQGWVARLDPAWLCGDAGLWHVGRRDRAHMLLLPPILSDGAATAMAEGVAHLREVSGREVLPENPPGDVFVGDLHLLDYFARVVDRGDTGMLLDCAHLAIYQRAAGHGPLTGLDAFPLDRIVEMHVAGGVERTHLGYRWVEDDHTPHVLDDTWQIFEHVVARAPNLRAVVFECERNPISACLPGLRRIHAAWEAHR